MKAFTAVLAASFMAGACSASHAPLTPSTEALAACDAIIAYHDQPTGVYETPPTGTHLTLHVGDVASVVLVASSGFGGWVAATLQNHSVIALRNQSGTFPSGCMYSATLVAVALGTTKVSAETFVPRGSARPALVWTITATVNDR